jgi:hypothetical protein
MMSPQQRKATIELIEAIVDVIKFGGEMGIPSGHIYAMMCDKVPLDAYNAIIDGLIQIGVVRRNGFHQLFWVGHNESVN